MRPLLIGYPEIDRQRRPAAFNDRVGKTDPTVELKGAGLYCKRPCVIPGSAVLSIILTRRPTCASQSAKTKPVGPAPTTRTSVSVLADTVMLAVASMLFLNNRSTKELDSFGERQMRQGSYDSKTEIR